MPGYRAVPISELTPGNVLATSVFDQQFTKLLDAGVTVDQHLIDRLQALGVSDVMVESAAKTVVRRPKMPLPPGVQVQAQDRDAIKTSIDQCSGCGTIIGLQPPSPDSKTCTWLCRSCGAVYFGRDEEGAERYGVLRGGVKIAPTAPSIPPANVQRLVKSLVPAEYTGPDRRAQKRYAAVVPVIALPLASDFRIAGEPVQMTTANVSLGGAALIHTRYVDSPYLTLDFTVAGIELLQVVLKVLRVRSVGPAYEIGGEFISRLSQRPD